MYVLIYQLYSNKNDKYFVLINSYILLYNCELTDYEGHYPLYYITGKSYTYCLACATRTVKKIANNV